MDSIAGVVLLGVVSLLVGAGLFLFVLGLGLLRWAPFRRVLYLLPILLLSAALVLAGALQLCVYLVPEFALFVSTVWAKRLALTQAGASGTVNLVMGLAFLGAGVLVGHVFYAAAQDAVRVGRRNRKTARQRQAVRLYAGSTTRKATAKGRASSTGVRPAANDETAPATRGARPAEGPVARPEPASGRFLRLGFKRR